MDVILASVRWLFALVYLGNIVIISKKAEKHIEHVKQVLTLLKHAGVRLNVKKCYFFTETIEYLGNVIRPRCLEIATHTTDTT